MWKIVNQDNSNAEILLYDIISSANDDDYGLINAKTLISRIQALGDIKNITLRINSIGGDVFQAQAMYSYLKSHPANITVRGDGITASAARLVAMAGNKSIMPENSLMMIHNPSGFAMGESKVLQKEAEILDAVRDSIANAYMAKQI